MKLRLNILVIAICGIILFNIGHSVGIAARGFMAGWEASANDIEKSGGEVKQLTDFQTLDLIPQSALPSNGVSVKNEVTGKTEKIFPMTIGVTPQTEDGNLLVMAVKMLIGLLVGAVSVVMLWQFAAFMRNIYKGQVFIAPNVTHLRILGGGMLLMGIISTVQNLVNTSGLAKAFAIKGYGINFTSAISADTLFFAVFVLIVAEAFAIGLKNQKEVDLTI